MALVMMNVGKPLLVPFKGHCINFQFPFGVCGIQSGISQMAGEHYAIVAPSTTHNSLLWGTLYRVDVVHNSQKSVNSGVRTVFQF